jgi:hypothetical protein
LLLSSEFAPVPATAAQVAAPAALPIVVIFSVLLDSGWGCSASQFWVSDATILLAVVDGSSALAKSLLVAGTSGMCG